jgi:hypothetical protein
VLCRLEGRIVFTSGHWHTSDPTHFTEDGQFHSILDAALLRHLTDTLSAEQSRGAINYIGGGAADFTAQED